MRRRSVLQALTMSPLIAALSACRHRVLPRCPNDPTWTTPDAPLTIDVHTHVFNATDLQVDAFVRRVAARQLTGGLARFAKYFGAVIQLIAWNTVPDAAAERRVLKKISDGARLCPDRQLPVELDAMRDEQYRAASAELRATATRIRSQRLLPSLEAGAMFERASDAEKGLRAIEALPATRAAMVQARFNLHAAADVSPERKSVDSALSFLVEMFQYRYGSVFQMLDTYNRPERKLDLLLAHLVDYDWWLGANASTPTSLRDQIEIMASISVLTGGRVHAFVPFCPLRELQHRRAPGSTFSSLELVKWAVESRGAMGVKLYPTMGFAPFGNAAHSGMWDKAEWLPSYAREPDFGARLDAVLTEFYDWCLGEDVPIMAHCNPSNAPASEFEGFASPDGWKLTLECFKTLRINFGHFGTIVPRGDPPLANATAFAALMSPSPQLAGARAYADAAYFSEALDQPQALEDELVRLLEGDAATGKLRASRLLFGSDWKMLLLEQKSEAFLPTMRAIADRVVVRLGRHDLASWPDDFLGRNAAAYLGLERGTMTRLRTQRFYDANRVTQPPGWQVKVDRT